MEPSGRRDLTVEYDVDNTVPVNKMIPGGGCSYPEAFRYQSAFRWLYEFREQLVGKMKEIDPNVNAFGIRALTAEIVNFIDGEKSIREIAESVGFEYDLKIEPVHVLEFLVKVEELGYVDLTIRK